MQKAMLSRLSGQHRFYIRSDMPAVWPALSFSVVVVVLESARAAVVTARTSVTISARAAVAVTARTWSAVSAFAARTSLALHVAFGLRCQHAGRQAVFAGLLVDLDQLDSELVALFEAARLHAVETIP